MYLIDSHCHLNFDGLKDRLPEVFANMEAQSVKQALAISVSKQSFAEVFDIAQANDHIYCTIGIHPDSQEAEEFTITEMVEAAKHPKIVGIGETAWTITGAKAICHGNINALPTISKPPTKAACPLSSTRAMQPKTRYGF